jgi:tricorn protease
MPPLLNWIPYCALATLFLLGSAGPAPGQASDENERPGAPRDGYYRYPTIHNDTIAFVAEDDLWTVPASGGTALRLTTSLSTVGYPRFSPDGNWIAFTGAEEGPQEVFVMPAQGGPVKRLTFLGSRISVLGWRGGDRIVFSSNHGQPNRQPPWLYSVALDGTGLERLPFGPADRFDESGKTVVLGRKMRRFAEWKRYRGGTAGEIYIDSDGDGAFQKLIELESNLFDPMILGERVYFLSDHERIGNLYSCAFDGTDLSKHTDHKDFYARNASTDGARIVYHSGADLYVYDPQTGASNKVNFVFPGARAQTNRRFEATPDFLEDYEPAPDGARIAITSRGKAFALACWEGPVLQPGEPHGVRYRLARFIDEATRRRPFGDCPDRQQRTA